MNTDKAGVLGLIDSDINYFECMVLQRLAFDPEFFNKHIEILRADPLGVEVDNFSNDQNNAAFRVLETLAPMLGVTPNYTETLLYAAFTALANEGKYLSHENAGTWANWLIRVLQMDYSLTLAMTEQGVLPWVQDKWQKLVMTRARMEGWDMDKMSEVMQTCRERLDIAAGDESRMFSAADIRNNRDKPQTERFRTRISDFNAKTGGGPGRKEGWLAIGAMGAGKSVLGANWAADFIRGACQDRGIHRRGLFITTELPAEEIYYRMYADMCNIPISMLQDGINPAKLSAEQMKEIDEAEELLTEYFRIYEWPRGSDRSVVTGLEADMAKAERAMGGQLDFLILDWIGGALGSDSDDERKIRLTYQNAGDQMAWTAKSHNMLTLSLAQAHVDRGLNKSWVDARALTECKQLGREMVGICGITGMLSSEEDMDSGKNNFRREQALCLGKSRKGAGGKVKVHQDFLFQRFKEP